MDNERIVTMQYFRNDWIAVVDGTDDDPDAPMGFGATEAKAIEDLSVKLDACPARGTEPEDNKPEDTKVDESSAPAEMPLREQALPSRPSAPPVI